jgi:hypothetical protein
MAPGVVVVTFATEEYADSAEVLRHSAVLNGGAKSVRIYTPSSPCVRGFYEDTGFSASERGAGYWGWKPRIIFDAMGRADHGDVVLYLDAATIVDDDLASRLRVSDRWDVKLFALGGHAKNGYTNDAWTKPAALDAMGATTEERAAFQVTAAVQAYRKHSASARAFLGEYWLWCDVETLADQQGFPNHRHDQSVLSVLAARHGCVTVAKDPTQHGVEDACRVEGDDLPPWIVHHRRQLRIPRVAVVTPTTGAATLERAIESVATQTSPGIVHWIVADGPGAVEAANRIADPWVETGAVRFTALPENTGAGGWNGHRIYGAVPWLSSADYVAFLDEDNWFEPDHVHDLLEAIVREKAAWAYSLRRIVDKDGNAICDDRCESLGPAHHTCLSPEDHLVDTSCYMIERGLAIDVSPCWNGRARQEGRVEVDRALCAALTASAPYAFVPKSSVVYRLGGNAASVQRDFFERGNAAMGVDFAKPALYVFHFDPKATAAFFATRRDRSRSYALDEWQPNLLRGLEDGYRLVDGFENVRSVPRGATVLAVMCDPRTLPLEMLRERTDLHRIVYTIESPNVRHAAQWKREFLYPHFDVALTYWEPLLAKQSGGFGSSFAFHNCHTADMDLPEDRALLRKNAGRGRSVAICLANRPLRGKFEIDGEVLTCLDPLRAAFVSSLPEVTAVGEGWEALAPRRGLRVVSGGKSVDERHAVDWYADHTFALIVENVDAEGYVSEKLYDALMAGAIPLYHGNPSKRLLEHVPDLDGLFVDIRGMSGRELREKVESFEESDVEAFRSKIYARREAVLRAVGVKAFARCVDAAIRPGGSRV